MDAPLMCRHWLDGPSPLFYTLDHILRCQRVYFIQQEMYHLMQQDEEGEDDDKDESGEGEHGASDSASHAWGRSSSRARTAVK